MIHARISRKEDNSIAEIHISITEDSLSNFQILIDRALNVWDQAPKELKDLGDILTHGKITQDRTPTKMNTLQNSDHATYKEFERCQFFIIKYGQQAFIEAIMDGSVQLIMSGKKI